MLTVGILLKYFYLSIFLRLGNVKFLILKNRVRNRRLSYVAVVAVVDFNGAIESSTPGWES